MQTTDFLWAAACALGGIAWNAQDKRITALETSHKDRAASDQTLREAVVKLTVTVEFLTAQIAESKRDAE